ncbi:hypothetical protein HO133_008304 [Letharia lupina]|uniref:Uncharacterized protein n=1 Tax=Letharia lupina TaxID=560253 RepID=A0A8H6FGC4_9LECA|nr:uncharacterized protein HO133_008304 [Letharia lupina]KAF6226863.1 hypothetical protein HO133_008304 [Letharia lupina]
MSAISNATPEQLQALLNGPALKPPPGVIPDFTDPSTSHRRGVAVEIVSLLLSAFAVAMHIYTKARFMHQMAAAACTTLLRNPLGMRVSSVLCEVCFNTSHGFLVGYFIIGWLVSDIAPGAKQWDVQLENLGSFLYED